jgi:N-methylhydantoinase A/oxoprolinase/acetone carboxylase beta subunit
MTFKYRLGVDIGGTFTDATLINETTGEVRVGKVPSTPKDPSLGSWRQPIGCYARWACRRMR